METSIWSSRKLVNNSNPAVTSRDTDSVPVRGQSAGHDDGLGALLAEKPLAVVIGHGGAAELGTVAERSRPQDDADAPLSRAQVVAERASPGSCPCTPRSHACRLEAGGLARNPGPARGPRAQALPRRATPREPGARLFPVGHTSAITSSGNPRDASSARHGPRTPDPARRFAAGERTPRHSASRSPASDSSTLPRPAPPARRAPRAPWRSAGLPAPRRGAPRRGPSRRRRSSR
jgi:hypothetical protein